MYHHREYFLVLLSLSKLERKDNDLQYLLMPDGFQIFNLFKKTMIVKKNRLQWNWNNHMTKDRFVLLMVMEMFAHHPIEIKIGVLIDYYVYRVKIQLLCTRRCVLYFLHKSKIGLRFNNFVH